MSLSSEFLAFVIRQILMLMVSFPFLQDVVGSRLQELALSLSLKCLSFDFVGTSIDESSEEFGTVQVRTAFYYKCAHFGLYCQ